MKKLAMAFALSSVLYGQAFANDFDCSGKGLRMLMTLDTIGMGITEVIRGNFNGARFTFTPQETYRPTPDVYLPERTTIEGVVSYSYYKHPTHNIVVRVTDPTLATYDDSTVDGTLFINGAKVEFTCYK